MSGFQRLAQLRPGPVVGAMVSPAGPRTEGGRLPREPIVERLFPLLALTGPGHLGRELRAGSGRARLGGSHRE